MLKSRVIFSKKLKQIIIHPLLVSFALLIYFWCLAFVAFQFACPMTQKSINLIFKLKNIEKHFVINMCLLMGGFTLLLLELDFSSFVELD